jgi:hypothetical protein
MTAQIPDPPPRLNLEQALLFRRVFIAVAERQGAIMPPSSAAICPAQWQEIAQAVALIAAEQFAPLPGLDMAESQLTYRRRVGDEKQQPGDEIFERMNRHQLANEEFTQAAFRWRPK